MQKFERQEMDLLKSRIEKSTLSPDLKKIVTSNQPLTQLPDRNRHPYIHAFISLGIDFQSIIVKILRQKHLKRYQTAIIELKTEKALQKHNHRHSFSKNYTLQIIERVQDFLAIEKILIAHNILDFNHHYVLNRNAKNKKILLGIYYILFESCFFVRFYNDENGNRVWVTMDVVTEELNKRFKVRRMHNIKESKEMLMDLAIDRIPELNEFEISKSW